MPFLEYIGVGIALTSFIGGIFAWYSAAVRKEYASQRDWEHVKNNQRQFQENVNFLFKEMGQDLENMRSEHDRRFDKIDTQGIKLESMFYASLTNLKHKIDNIDQK